MKNGGFSPFFPRKNLWKEKKEAKKRAKIAPFGFFSLCFASKSDQKRVPEAEKWASFSLKMRKKKSFSRQIQWACAGFPGRISF